MAYQLGTETKTTDGVSLGLILALIGVIALIIIIMIVYIRYINNVSFAYLYTLSLHRHKCKSRAKPTIDVEQVSIRVTTDYSY